MVAPAPDMDRCVVLGPHKISSNAFSPFSLDATELMVGLPRVHARGANVWGVNMENIYL
jgi:hypothetical protein